MQPYVNPNYFGQYPQFQPSFNAQQDAYMNRLNNLQQFQQSLQPQPVNQFPVIGKMVESVDIVKTTDIPMDGNTYYFPKADGTEIYSKQWMANGQTRILAFKPVLDNDADNSAHEAENGSYKALKELYDNIQSELQTLNDKIDKISKPSAPKKREAVTDEQ